VILSTHIVEDVADLCPRMAVLAGGRLLREGSPASLVRELEGRVWRRVVDKADLAGLSAIAPVISTRLSAGRTVVHLLSETSPGPGFETVEGGLEDVYFAALHSARQAA
jgi:ABC-type multidrug transport system ATPase subunit